MNDNIKQVLLDMLEKELKYVKQDLIYDIIRENFTDDEMSKEKMIAIESEQIWNIECADPDWDDENYIYYSWFIYWQEMLIKKLITSLTKKNNDN